jgi:hypothetical protein
MLAALKISHATGMKNVPDILLNIDHNKNYLNLNKIAALNATYILRVT